MNFIALVTNKLFGWEWCFYKYGYRTFLRKVHKLGDRKYVVMFIWREKHMLDDIKVRQEVKFIKFN